MCLLKHDSVIEEDSLGVCVGGGGGGGVGGGEGLGPAKYLKEHYVNILTNMQFCPCMHIARLRIMIKLCVYLKHGIAKCAYITKTCLYDTGPLKPHFYIVKLGYTGVYVIFLISASKHIMWVLVRTASSRRF